MKRKSPTVADKHAIIEEKENNPTLTMDQLADKHGVAKSTISGILGPQRSKIKDAFSKGTKSSKIMKFRKFSFEAVDRNLKSPKSTSILQPLDAGIIRSFKHKYRKLLAQKRLMAYDAQCDFKFNLFDALTLIRKAWNYVSQETIKNCYLKCGFKDQEVMETSELELMENGSCMGSSNGMQFTRIKIYV